MNIEYFELRKKVAKICKNKFLDTEIVIGLGKISIPKSGIDKTINQPLFPKEAYLEKLDVLLALETYLPTSEYICSGIEHKSNSMVKQYHYLKVKDKNLYINIRELKDGKFLFYSITGKIKSL